MVALANDPAHDERTHRRAAEHERVIRTYLDHHLPPAGRDAALAEALEEARHWGDTDLEDVLRCARRGLLARTVPDPEDEAAVLVARCGLEASAAATVTGIDETVVRRAVNVHLAEQLPPARPTTERTARDAEPAELDRLRRQERLTRIGIAALLGVAVLAIVGLVVVRGDGDDPVPTAATEFEVDSLTVTHDPAADAAQELFTAGERVVVRIDYVPGDRDVNVDLSVLAPGRQPVLDTGVRLPRVRDRVQVPIPGRLLEEPGNYRVSVSRDGETIAEVGFTVTD